MAVSSTTTATVYISRRQSFVSAPRSCRAVSHSNSIDITLSTLTTKPRKFIVVRSSASGTDASAETITTTTETEEDSIEVSEESPSLISTLNVERALRGVPITDVDYYGTLGIQRGCSNDQVYEAYNKKVEELLNKGLGEEEISNKLELLKESYSVLSNAKERRLYDWSLTRSEKPDNYVWPFEVDSTKKSTESPPAQEPEDVGPTRLVGYFMLAWLVLGFTLSIALNR